MSNIFNYAPNQREVLDAVAGTSWHMVDINGADNGSTAAGAWPNLDPGGFLQTLKLRSKTSADADGSAFEYAINKLTTPASGELISGNGQTHIIAPGNVFNIWVKKTISTDIVEIVGRF